MRGLVLEGGGVKGAFHAGVLKALFDYKHKCTFNGVVGTSIGALNGALIAQNDFQSCYNLWEKVTPSLVIDVDDSEIGKAIAGHYSISTIKYFLKTAYKTIGNKGFSIDKLKELVDEYIDEEKIRNSKIIFGLVTVNITDNWEALELFVEDIPVGKIGAYIMASAYYPAFNRPEINGKRYIDGGIYNNLPINLLIRKGFENLLVIRTMSKMPNKNTIDGSIQIDYIEPSEDLGRSFDFTKKHVAYLLKLGYFDGLRYIHNYLGKKYYIKNTSLTFSNNLAKNFKNFYENNISDTGFSYAEYIAVIKQKHEISVLNSDLDAVLVLLEQVAIKMKIKKFKIYSIKEFVKIISNSIIESEDLTIFEKFLIKECKEN
ncbi:MAG: patatin-like phospholipase family protein [Christensenellales bacterium]|jgi:NTE family protein|nr:patatin-like phospholipase family protein [Clostridiales bacterium]